MARKGYKKKNDENWVKQETVANFHLKAKKALSEVKKKESKVHQVIYDHPTTVRAKVIKRFFIVEAFELAKKRKMKVSNIELAGLLWADSSESTKKVNISKLINSHVSTIKFEWISIICDYLKVDANFLFGTDKSHKKEVKE